MAVPLHYLLNPVKTVRVKELYRLICKILGLFVNPLTADDKYSPLNKGNLLQHFQIQLSQKQKNVSDFFFFLHFLYLDLNLKIYKKR